MLWVFHNSTCADWRNSEKCKKAANHVEPCFLWDWIVPQHRIATASSSEQAFIYMQQPNNGGAPDQMLWVHYGQIYVCQKLIGAPDLMLWVFHNSTCAGIHIWLCIYIHIYIYRRLHQKRRRRRARLSQNTMRSRTMRSVAGSEIMDNPHACT